MDEIDKPTNDAAAAGAPTDPTEALRISLLAERTSVVNRREKLLELMEEKSRLLLDALSNNEAAAKLQTQVSAIEKIIQQVTERVLAIDRLVAACVAQKDQTGVPDPASTSPPPQQVRLPSNIPVFREATQDPIAYLEMFSALMQAHQVPQKTWSTALLAGMRSLEVSWVRENIADKQLLWNDAKDKFLGHFLSPALLNRFQSDFNAIRQGPHEDAQVFSDRFAQAASRAKKKVDGEVTHFIESLRDDIKLQVRLLASSNADAVSSFEKASQTVLGIQAALENRSKRSNPTSSGPPESGQPSDSSRSQRHPFCRRCECEHPYGEHIATSSSRPAAPPAQRSSSVRSSHVDAPTLAPEFFAVEVDTAQDPSDGDPHLPVSVPILLNGLLFSDALLDSGSSHSFVHPSVPSSLDPEPVIQPRCIPVKLAMDSSSSTISGTVELDVSHGNKTASGFTFFICNVSPPHRVIIGRDLMPRLGLGFSGISVTLPPRSLPPELTSTARTRVCTDEDPFQSHREAFLSRSADVITANKEIADGSFCTHPDALIRLDTGDAKPLHRKQYPIPQSAHPVIDAFIDELAPTSLVVPAPQVVPTTTPF